MTRKSGLLILALALAGGVSTAGADAIGDNNICYAQFATGDYRSAIDYCTRAIDSGELSDDDLVTALLNRGVALKSTGEHDRAIEDYTRALAIVPDDALLYQNRANAYREKGDIAPALAEALGNQDVARRYYMTALGLDPQNEVYRSKAFGEAAQ